MRFSVWITYFINIYGKLVRFKKNQHGIALILLSNVTNSFFPLTEINTCDSFNINKIGLKLLENQVIYYFKFNNTLID